MKHLLLALLITLATATGSTVAVACPKVGGLPDFNCDGTATVVVLGDSIVSGTGDTKNSGIGGYVVRTQQAFPAANIMNLGVAGLRTRGLISDIKASFNGTGATTLADALIAADLVVVDLGRNDRWEFGPPLATFRNLKRIRSLIGTGVTTRGAYTPLVVLSVLLLPNRGNQSPWITVLNDMIVRSDSATAPADLHFDTVSKRLLSSDRLHPTSKGYTAIARVFVNYLKTQYPRHSDELRYDDDNDGLYDIFEAARFGTDPQNPDTDGDGFIDGEDSNPLDP